MEKDIIERLYDISERPDCEYSTVLYDAVTEIERLRLTLNRLVLALNLIDSVSVHSGGDIHGVNPKEWESAFKQVQAMAHEALEVNCE